MVFLLKIATKYFHRQTQQNLEWQYPNEAVVVAVTLHLIAIMFEHIILLKSEDYRSTLARILSYIIIYTFIVILNYIEFIRERYKGTMKFMCIMFLIEIFSCIIIINFICWKLEPYISVIEEVLFHDWKSDSAKIFGKALVILFNIVYGVIETIDYAKKLKHVIKNILKHNVPGWNLIQEVFVNFKEFFSSPDSSMFDPSMFLIERKKTFFLIICLILLGIFCLYFFYYCNMLFIHG